MPTKTIEERLARAEAMLAALVRGCILANSHRDDLGLLRAATADISASPGRVDKVDRDALAVAVADIMARSDSSA